MLSNIKNENGYLVVSTTAVIMLLLSLLVIGLIPLTTADRSLSIEKGAQEQALYIAESGANYALVNLEEPSSQGGHADDATPWRPNGTTPIYVQTGTAYFLVAVQDTGPGAVKITSTGYIKTSTAWVSKQVVVNAKRPVPDAFAYSLFSNSDFSMSGNVTVNSLDSNNGNVHVNGAASLNGNPTINGRLDATGSISTSGHPTITNGTHSNSQAISMPPIDTTSLYNKAFALGVTNQDVNISGSGTTTLQGVINGNLSISGGASVAINQIVYVTGNVSLSGTFSGTGAIVTNGTISVSGNVNYSSSSDKLAFISLASGTAVSLSGNTSVSGVIYAPNGRVSISGTPSVTGAVVANGIDLNGNATITHDPNLDSLSAVLPGGPYKITLWKEQ